ncbi:MAG: NusG domain II-containing protein, partial [Lachnospiraceae bacterium]|nr:NusG domain II-containing protein [Lachnospiraceae bacterium]
MKGNSMRMIIMKKTDFLLLAATVAAALICILFLRHTQSGADGTDTSYYVVIQVAGEEVARLPLEKDTTYSIDQGDMHNTVVIEDGGVFVSEADCTNQNCVRQG